MRRFCVVLSLMVLVCDKPVRAEPALDIDCRALREGKFCSPLPGGRVAGYVGDTGLDIVATRGAVRAVAAGTLDYSEAGHTRWTQPPDTPNSVRLALDEPIAFRGKKITHVYYTHLSKLERTVAEGATPRVHVSAGEKLGVSGVGNRVPHLHVGFLLDGRVEQDSWDFLLDEGAIRQVTGGYKNGEAF